MVSFFQSQKLVFALMGALVYIGMSLVNYIATVRQIFPNSLVDNALVSAAVLIVLTQVALHVVMHLIKAAGIIDRIKLFQVDLAIRLASRGQKKNKSASQPRLVEKKAA